MPNNTSKAVTTESEFQVNVAGMLELSIINCDSTSSSVVAVDIVPSTTGTFKSNCQTVGVNTNNLGYSLMVKADTSILNYQNPTSATPKPTIDSTINTLASPDVLETDAWGFALENRLNFDQNYSINNDTNIYAQMPTTDTTIYTDAGWPLTTTSHNFYYAAKLTPVTTAGVYMATITYTAIGQMPNPYCNGNTVICVEVTEPGTVAIQNLWTNPITYTINGSDKVAIAAQALSTNLDVVAGDIFEIEEAIEDVSFRFWGNLHQRGLVTNTTTTGTARASITKMPPMNRFTTDETGAIAGDFFFHYFAGIHEGNYPYPVAISSLPDGSFDTSGITSARLCFFCSFTRGNSNLASLPDGSFNTSNISSSVGDYFFFYFNRSGILTTLPVGSFNINKITSVGIHFFAGFNMSGALTTLPVGSFDTSNITSVAGTFFYAFNGDSASTTGKLQTGTGITITNKSSSSVTFWRRPNGNPNGTATSINVSNNGKVTYLSD